MTCPALVPRMLHPPQTIELEQIVVTANGVRRIYSSRRSPRRTGEELTKRNVNTVDSLMFNTPSLTVQTRERLGQHPRYWEKRWRRRGASGVLIYRDGVSTTPNGLISD